MSDDGREHIRYACIGHCCHDKTDNGYDLGGTAAYSAFVANDLGADVKIITSVGSDFLYTDEIVKKGIGLFNLESEETTVFENIYGQGARQQFIHSRAEDLISQKVLPHINDIDILHLCPIANEVDYEILKQFTGGFIGATIQGSLRCWEGDGKIYPCKMEWERLKGIEVVIISDEDVIGLDRAIENLKEVVPYVVVTMGAKGAKLIIGKASLFLPSFNITPRRETGAGDTFATAFFINYYKSKDPFNACIYAHAVTSLVLERDNGMGFPGEDEIHHRMEQYQKNQSH